MPKIKFIIYRSDLNNLQTRQKKLKNTNQLEFHFLSMTILKAFKRKYCLSLGTCHKYVMQFTDPTPTVYWYAKRAKLTFYNYDSTKYNPIKIMLVPGYV